VPTLTCEANQSKRNHMAWLLTLILLADIPRDPVLTDYVDMIEISHVHSRSGNGEKHVNHYYIFWDWDGWNHRVVDWRHYAKQRPQRFGNQWLLRFTEEEGGQQRRIICKYWRETSTDYDPELFDRQFLRECDRRKLNFNIFVLPGE